MLARCDKMGVRTTLITKFAIAPDEEQLNNLNLWLDQTEFRGFESVDYRFEYSLDGTIRCHVPGGLQSPDSPHYRQPSTAPWPLSRASWDR